MELTPDLLAVPTPCRWLIIKTRGRFSADKTALFGAGLNSEPDTGGGCILARGEHFELKECPNPPLLASEGCLVLLSPWWVLCRDIQLPLSIYGCAFKWECNSCLQHVLILRTQNCPWPELRSVPIPTNDIGFTQQLGSDRGKCHKWSQLDWLHWSNNSEI